MGVVKFTSHNYGQTNLVNQKIKKLISLVVMEGIWKHSFELF